MEYSPGKELWRSKKAYQMPGCGRVGVMRGERGPAPKRCDICREEHDREKNREYVQAVRTANALPLIRGPGLLSA
jgi:hypothetical protein